MWMNMDLAPLDGTLVLVCHCDRPRYAPEAAFYGTYHPNSLGKSCWRSANTDTKLVCTHWMPLPPHPTRVDEIILNQAI